jgi:HK97 family phage prohead protease
MSDHDSRLPRENIIRAVFFPGVGISDHLPVVEFRDATEADLEAGHLGLLRILFSPVNEWAEINSMWEGKFMERFAPGSWKKTISDNARKIRSLFQHGMDPQVGDKPLGPISLLEENDRGGYGEVPLLDTSYNRDLLPGLKAGLYGASHRFSVMREEIVDEPDPSDTNPHGLPERTIKEARLMEFGPVTFPAYAGATAGVRSLTDHFIQRCFEQDRDKLRAMFEQGIELDVPERDDQEQDPAPSEGDAAAEPHLTDERREPQDPSAPVPLTTRKVVRKYLTPRKEHSSWAIPH